MFCCSSHGPAHALYRFSFQHRLSCLRPWRRSRSNRRARRQPGRRRRQLSRAQTRLNLWTVLQKAATVRKLWSLLNLRAPSVQSCKVLSGSAIEARLAVLAANHAMPHTASSHQLHRQASLALLQCGVCHHHTAILYTHLSASPQAFSACLAVAAAQASLLVPARIPPVVAEAPQSLGHLAA